MSALSDSLLESIVIVDMNSSAPGAEDDASTQQREVPTRLVRETPKEESTEAPKEELHEEEPKEELEETPENPKEVAKEETKDEVKDDVPTEEAPKEETTEAMKEETTEEQKEEVHDEQEKPKETEVPKEETTEAQEETTEEQSDDATDAAEETDEEKPKESPEEVARRTKEGWECVKQLDADGKSSVEQCMDVYHIWEKYRDVLDENMTERLLEHAPISFLSDEEFSEFSAQCDQTVLISLLWQNTRLCGKQRDDAIIKLSVANSEIERLKRKSNDSASGLFKHPTVIGMQC